jgi:tRNA nucleotidyltransferase/poly(A) polymerase
VLPRHIGHEQRSVALVREVCARLRIQNELRDLALLVAAEHGLVHRIADAQAPALVRLFERCDAFRKPARFEDLLLACEADARGRAGLADRDYPQADRLRAALSAARAVDAGAIAQATAQSREPRAGSSRGTRGGGDAPACTGHAPRRSRRRYRLAEPETARDSMRRAGEPGRSTVHSITASSGW